MRVMPNPPAPAQEPSLLQSAVRAALTYLLKAYHCARECQRSPWDFAVELPELRRVAGVTTIDLRWLFCKGYINHAADRTKAGQPHRVFGKRGALSFAENSCFVLTMTGVSLASTVCSRTPEIEHMQTPGQLYDLNTVDTEAPAWDGELRELWAGEKIVKRYSRPAPNQEMILTAFQEEGWPRHIYNPPSPRDSDDDIKQRLNDTIKRLNRHQRHDLIRFRADGSGEGILWEFAGACDTNPTLEPHQIGS